MKLLITFLSILSLGSAVNHLHPLRLSDAQLEKIQSKTMLEHANGDRDLNNEGICYSTMNATIDNDELNELYGEPICTDGKDEDPSCTFDFDNATLLAQFTDICGNDYDGRVEIMNVIDICLDVHYSESNYQNLDGELYETPDGDFYNLYNFILPVCVPNTCTGEEVIEFYYQLITEEERLVECVPDDILFVVQDKMKTKSSPKSKKTKTAKSMKDDSKKKNSSPKSKKTKAAKSMKGSKKSKST
jgi:hypothetical protein